MQNVPLELRELYTADSPEHVLISADWSQVEWRLSIVGAGDDKGLEILASGRDNHRAVASEVLDMKYEMVTDEQRHGAKFILYGLSYGRGAKSIAKENNRELSWVNNFINRFSKTFDDVWKERERWVKMAEKQNYVANPFGRRRWWFTQMATEIYNFWPSSTAADMMIDVLTAMDADAPKGVELVLTVHDEVVASAPKDQARVAYEWMQDHMNRKWPIITEASRNEKLVREYYPDGWFCPAEAEFGNNWRECKKGNASLKKELLG
jgi:DNA polymerase-1